MTQEEHNVARLDALESLSKANQDIACADSKIQSYRSAFQRLNDRARTDHVFEGDGTILPDDTLFEYPSPEELRRVLTCRLDALKQRQAAREKLTSLGVSL